LPETQISRLIVTNSEETSRILNKEFQIEFSYDAKNWELAEVVPGANNSNTVLNYFGQLALESSNGMVTSFTEKNQAHAGWINGGFFVLHPSVIEKIKDDETVWEKQPLNDLAKEGQLMAYKHHGFWMPMDTLRDQVLLNQLWDSGKAYWKKW
jgi:NDP-sugar pyrophosphorylase family protein